MEAQMAPAPRELALAAKQCSLDLILEHGQAEPLIAISNNLFGVELSQCPCPVEVLEGTVERRAEDEKEEDRPQVGLRPEVLLLEEGGWRERCDLSNRLAPPVPESLLSTACLVGLACCKSAALSARSPLEVALDET
eukprot:CAMPEP_0178401598 /NCGR_PEP_ID=MMETSP0689_2-20121128/16386_1 /TAXON_ID=160604 /ORGANISM="Amphidinium massartii, Strain CS-259" /LENGTH=136 /DNA_ID=CAMNT_0020022427 /DNA_START=144 /DNA_END=554 /DNA_ORIENTATION=-